MKKNIEDLISNKRLEGYLGASNNTLKFKLHRYSYNIDLSQSFYPNLHLLEVSLRNTLHFALGDGNGLLKCHIEGQLI